MTDIASLRALLAAATPGPWYQTDDPDPDDAALIVAAVNALPALLDVAEAARDTVDDLDGIYSLRAALAEYDR